MAMLDLVSPKIQSLSVSYCTVGTVEMLPPPRTSLVYAHQSSTGKKA
jgi:hypothetical protein